MMKPLGLVTLSLLGASALAFLACATSNGSPHAGPGAGGAGAGGAGAGGSDGSAAGGGDAGLTVDLDSGPGDGASGCKHLNIGIFGKPGWYPSANFQQWLVLSGTSVQRIQITPDEPVTAATVQPFDVVVLDWLQRDYSASEAAVLAAFVSAGGGVVSMSGYDNNTIDDWHANSLLAPFGVAYGGPLLDQPVTSFATHPITAGLTSVTFEGGYAISDLGGTASMRTPIAFLPQGAGNVNVGVAIQMGMGRAFVWGDEWIQFDSEWSTLPQIKRFWVQVFAWVAPNTCMLTPPA